jgi:hypothetical protein
MLNKMKKFLNKYDYIIIAALAIIAVLSMCGALLSADMHLQTISEGCLITSLSSFVLMVALSVLM